MQERRLAVGAILFAVCVGVMAVGAAAVGVASADAPTFEGQTLPIDICDSALRMSSVGGVSVATEDQGFVGPDGCDLAPSVARSWAETPVASVPLVTFDCSVVYPATHSGPQVNVSQVPRSPAGYCIRVATADDALHAP